MTVSLYNCGHCKLPQLVGQPCHCRTPEDEAFDELAKKQGHWGGGYQAKRQMAADKINADFDEEYKKMHEDRIKYGTSWEKNGKRIDPMSVYKEPAQEPEMQTGIAYQKGFHDGKQAALAHPAQEPLSEWAGIKAILDEYGLQAIDFVADFKAALAQPAHSEWNAALDEAAARIGEIKGFGQATQDSFAVFIQGLKK